MSDVKPYNPIAYAPWTLLAGIGLLVAAVLFVAIVFWLTRQRKPRAVTLPPPDVPALQQKYLALIDEVEKAQAAGELSARALHQKLSILLRFFAYETNGVAAPMLTLKDLKMTKLTLLTEAVETYYVPEFSAVSHGDAAAAIARARQVVTTWS